MNFDKVVFNAYGANELEALNGENKALAQANVMGFKQNYENELFAWDGYARDDEARVELDIPLDNEYDAPRYPGSMEITWKKYC